METVVEDSKTPKTPINNNAQFCEICKIQLPEDMNMQSHILTTMHEKSYNAAENQNIVTGEYGLYVRGYGSNANRNHLLSLFAKFGTIVWAHFGYDYLLLDYTDEESMKKALSKSHYFNGVRLLVKRKEVRKTNNDAVKEEEDLNIIVQKLKNISTFSEQYNYLIKQLQPDVNAQFRTCELICRDMFMALVQTYPQCRIHPFGSTMNGLSFKRSDLDVYMSGISINGEDVKSLYKIRKFLYSSQNFTNGIVIANAKIPILKCRHIKSQMNCDINVRNMLGVCNTELIKYYLSINPKVKMVLMILKFWAKVHKLTGQNNLFTNYSLALMLIFFLQNSAYIFPSVSYLQQCFTNIQDGWNGHFRGINVMSSQLNLDAPLKILSNFFHFYSEFDYSVDIICPYLGYTIKKDDFKTIETVPNNFQRYIFNVNELKKSPLKVETAICVQDPFEHNRNTTPIVSESTLSAFVNMCRYSKKIICDQDELNILYKVFSEEPEDVKPQLIPVSIARQFVIPMGVSTGYLYKDCETDSQDRRRIIFDRWFEILHKFMQTVLQDVLSFEVKEVDGTSHKNMKRESQTDIHDQNKQIRYKCAAMLSLWHGRKNVKMTQDISDVGFLAKEVATTKMLLDMYKDVKPKESVVEIEIIMSAREDSRSVLIEINKIKSYKKTFKSFGDYFVAKFPVWFKMYEKELNS